MKRVALTATILTAFAWPAVLLAAGSLPGTYTATIKNTPPVTGTWRLTFSGVANSRAHTTSGSFAFTLRGKVWERGGYTTTGSHIAFTDDPGTGCGTAGEVYFWNLTAKKLRFAVVSPQPCLQRALLLQRFFTKIG